MALCFKNDTKAKGDMVLHRTVTPKDTNNELDTLHSFIINKSKTGIEVFNSFKLN